MYILMALVLAAIESICSFPVRVGFCVAPPIQPMTYAYTTTPAATASSISISEAITAENAVFLLNSLFGFMYVIIPILFTAIYDRQHYNAYEK